MKAQSSAYQKFIHTSPRKLRLVADAIRGKNVVEAADFLKFSSKFASQTMAKILSQAKANAANVFNLSPEGLTVKDVIVEEGPRIKRWRAVSRGMAHSIIKRTSHVKLVVEGNLKEAQKETPKETHKEAVKPAKKTEKKSEKKDK